jgi:hypothetical protein
MCFRALVDRQAASVRRAPFFCAGITTAQVAMMAKAVIDDVKPVVAFYTTPLQPRESSRTTPESVDSPIIVDVGNCTTA